jgi:hypothetical protein
MDRRTKLKQRIDKLDAIKSWLKNALDTTNAVIGEHHLSELGDVEGPLVKALSHTELLLRELRLEMLDRGRGGNDPSDANQAIANAGKERNSVAGSEPSAAAGQTRR